MLMVRQHAFRQSFRHVQNERVRRSTRIAKLRSRLRRMSMSSLGAQDHRQDGAEFELRAKNFASHSSIDIESAHRASQGSNGLPLGDVAPRIRRLPGVAVGRLTPMGRLTGPIIEDIESQLVHILLGWPWMACLPAPQSAEQFPQYHTR